MTFLLLTFHLLKTHGVQSVVSKQEQTLVLLTKRPNLKLKTLAKQQLSTVCPCLVQFFCISVIKQATLFKLSLLLKNYLQDTQTLRLN
jgi:hypothetical protein